MPIFGWFLKKFGMVPVDRGKGSDAVEAMTRRARRAIAEGRQIIIFPEGTRRPPLAPPDYRYGIVRLYRDLGVPCLPIALNSGLYWPRRSLIHRPGRIVMAILPPIPPGRDPDAFAADLKAALESASAALLAEAFARQPELRPATAD
jgi:1-acyl-sn-glycerol-3-phosphate acyltransferase